MSDNQGCYEMDRTDISMFKILEPGWEIYEIFFICFAKDSHIFSTKDNGVFDNVVSIYLMSGRLNDVVRLTML